MVGIRLNGYDLELLQYLQENPDSWIVKYRANYWYTYIHNSRQSVTVARINKFEKYGLIELVVDRITRKEYRVSEQGKEFKV